MPIGQSVNGLSNVLSLLLIIILALLYLVDFSANSKTSHELVKVSVPEARKVASVECSKVFLSSGSDISGMYIAILY